MLLKTYETSFDLQFLVDKLSALDSKLDPYILQADKGAKGDKGDSDRDLIPDILKRQPQVVLLEGLLKQLEDYKKNKKDYVEKARSLSATIQSWEGLFNVGTLVEPTDLVKEYTDSGATLVENLRIRRDKEKREAITGFVRRMFELTQKDDLKTEELTNNLEQTVARAMLTTELPSRHFVDVYDEVEDVRKGQDESEYMGDPNEDQTTYTVDALYKVPMANAIEGAGLIVPSKVIEDTESADAPFPNEVLKKYLQPEENAAIPNGTREVLVPVVNMLERILMTSGLPILMKDIILQLTQMTAVLSRVARVKLNKDFKDLDDEGIVGIFNAMDTSITPLQTLSKFEQSKGDLLPDGFIEAIIEANKEYFQNVENTFLKALCLWTFQIQASYLENKKNSDEGLIFDPTDGLKSVIHYWSPYGPPLTKSNDGCLVYLAAVTAELVKNTVDEGMWKFKDHTNILHKINERAYLDKTGPFTTEIFGLKQVYSSIFDAHSTDPTTRAQMFLNDALSSKRDATDVLTRYHNVLLLLPQIYHKKDSNALMYPGCCVQEVGSSYAPDKDISNYASQFAAPKMNQLIEAKHWLSKSMKGLFKYDRFRLTSIGKPFTHGKINIEKHGKYEKHGIESSGVINELAIVNYSSWLDKLTFIPVADKNEITKESSSALQKAKVGLRKFFTATKPLNPDKKTIEDYMITDEDTIPEDFETIIRLVIVELSKLSTNENTTDQEKTFLTTIIDDLIGMIKLLRDGLEIAKTDAKIHQKIKNVLKFASVLAIQMPFAFIGTQKYSTTFKEALTSQLLTGLLKKIVARRLITKADIAKMIAYRREEYKNELLAKSEGLSKDDRKLLKAFKDLNLAGFYDDAPKEPTAALDLDTLTTNPENFNPEMAAQTKDYEDGQEYDLEEKNEDYEDDDLLKD